MGFSNLFNTCRITLIFIFLFAISIPAAVFCAGYQEEKLFDGDFYTSEELKKNIENHNKEIKVLNDQIKSLEVDIDWLVLKINQIEDTGRKAHFGLKDALSKNELKINTLTKSKTRLEYLVLYYSKLLKSVKTEQPDKKILKEVQAKKKKKPATDAYSWLKQRVGSPDRKEPSPPLDNNNIYEGISVTELQKAVNEANLGDWVEVVGTGSCLKIETTMPILFPTGSARVSKDYQEFFKKLADFLKPYDVKVLVAGYADKVPIKNKKYPSNFELGATRAANIVHQFVGYGLKPSIFKIESTGKYRYAAKQRSLHKSFERRAEVTIIFSG